MSRAVMQQALEALEQHCTPYIDGTHPADETITALRKALAQPEPAPGYCKRCKDYTIEEPLFEQTKQQKRVWIEISEQEMPEGLRSNWQFIAGIVWAQGKLKEKNATAEEH